MADLNTTRRGLLGTMVALPALGLAAMPVRGASWGNWEAAQAAYVNADKAMQAYDRDYLAPASDRYMAWRGQWPMTADINDIAEMKDGYEAESALYDPVQEHFDALVEARSEALDAMMECPAPHANAVADKIEALVTDRRWECKGFEEAMGHLLADLRRLGVN